MGERKKTRIECSVFNNRRINSPEGKRHTRGKKGGSTWVQKKLEAKGGIGRREGFRNRQPFSHFGAQKHQNHPGGGVRGRRGKEAGLKKRGGHKAKPKERGDSIFKSSVDIFMPAGGRHHPLNCGGKVGEEKKGLTSMAGRSRERRTTTWKFEPGSPSDP